MAFFMSEVEEGIELDLETKYKLGDIIIPPRVAAGRISGCYLLIISVYGFNGKVKSNAGAI